MPDGWEKFLYSELFWHCLWKNYDILLGHSEQQMASKVKANIGRKVYQVHLEI